MLFEGPRLKIARAGEHLDALRAEMERDIGVLLSSRVKLQVTITPLGPTRGDELPVHLVLPLPMLRWGLLVGDVVHNLRSSLDHAVEELTVQHRGARLPLTAFPVFTNPRRYYRRDPHGEPAPKSGVYAVRGVAPAAAVVIEAAQPFHAARPRTTNLWQLHELWNLDKHRVTPLVVTRAPYPDFAFPAGLPGNPAVTPGTVPGWDASRDAFARVDPSRGAQLQIGFEFQTLFGPGVAEGEPVVAKLRALRDSTRELLDRLAAVAE